MSRISFTHIQIAKVVFGTTKRETGADVISREDLALACSNIVMSKLDSPRLVAKTS